MNQSKVKKVFNFSLTSQNMHLHVRPITVVDRFKVEESGQ